ncbi:MAG: uroporphyrinogen decarboxylase [Bacteroidetes bacterium]|nr:MAG: uroporphyrinogen decarboxylase [Bacteroidota bacterium]
MDFQGDGQLQNDLILRVARGEAVERPPVWLMRQAGRFLKEYRAVRARAGSFKNMIARPEYAAEVTLQPVDLIGVDAAIIFSDILVIPEAMGLPYEMVPGKGPLFPRTVRSEQELQGLRPVAEESNLNDTYEAIRLVKKRLNGRVPLIGFAGAPWTIFCYMTEGSGSKTFSVAKAMLYRAPELAHALLQQITQATITYLKGQIAAGADLLQLFDSWAGVLNRPVYRRFALPYLRQICEAIQEVPLIVFAKGAFFALEELAELDCEVIGLDWQCEPDFALPLVGNKALQGNMDPCQLYAEPEEVAAACRAMLKAFPKGRHIANLGHGIYPDLPRESVQAFVNTVKAFSYEKE